jgi:Holliday junction resolvase RusA-like endonuclease
MIRIILPLPDRRLSPNNKPGTRGGRMAMSAAAKKARKAAKIVAMAAARESRHVLPWTRARATAVFYWRDARRRDILNADASLKAYFDGIVDAGVIVDDHSGVLSHGETEFRIDKEEPRVEILIEPVMEESP